MKRANNLLDLYFSSPYDDMETQGVEGASCNLASTGNLSLEAFHGQHVHVHTDSSDASIDRIGRYN